MKLPLRPVALNLLAVLAAIAAAPASATTITFASLASPDDQYFDSYSEGGYTFTTSTPCGPAGPGSDPPSAACGFGSWGSNSGQNLFISEAMFNNFRETDGFSTTTLTRDGGGAFDLLSIDLFLLQFRDGDTTSAVSFTGHKTDGTTVTTASPFALDYTGLSAPYAFTTFDFSGFTDLVSVEWRQERGAFHQFDNLVLTESTGGPGTNPAPEPASIALAGLALLGLAATRRALR